MSSPLGLTLATAARTDAPSDIRVGVVAAVTSRGISVSVADGLIEGAGHLTSCNPAVGDTVSMISYANSWVVLGRILGPGTATDSASPGTALGCQLLDGMVLTMSGTVLATSTGSAVVVPRYTLSVYHPPGHWLEVRSTYTYFSTTNGDVIQVQLYEGISGDQIGAQEHVQPVGASTFVTTTWVVPPTYGGRARTFGLKVLRFSGSGNCRLEDHSVRRGSFFAVDLGDQSMIRTA